MSELGEVEAAIERLKAYRFPEVWTHCYSVLGDEGNSSIIADDGRVPAASVVPQYADLIVILHRTIDAQLEILQTVVDMGVVAGGEGAAALPLARAINGTAA